MGLRVFLGVIAVFFGLVPAAFGEVRSLRMPKGKKGEQTIQLDVPKNWNVVTDVFGMPLMIIGTSVDGRRPVVTVTNTEMSGVQILKQDAREVDAGYQAGRNLWLQQFNGKALRFYSYTTETLAKNVADHSLGFEYRVGMEEMGEQTHYILCNNELFHIKAVYGLGNRTGITDIKTLIRSFRCAP